MSGNSNLTNEQPWENRPDGMHVQPRLEDHDQGSASAVATVKVNVTHGPAQFDVHVPAHSTFGDLKRAIVEKTGLEVEHQKLLFRGQEKEDNERLDDCGVRENSKVLVLEEAVVSNEERREEVMEDSEAMRKALLAVAGVRAEVDQLSERVAALEVAVNSGTKLAVEEFDVSAELLMRQLLKLDGIEAEGEAKLQRKAEVHRIQKFHETLDKLKAANSNPFVDSSNTVNVTTQWETFDNGMGSLNPPPSMPSSTNVNQDWERFD